MCGINGIFNFGTSQHVNEQQLCKMRDALALRGPDDRGFYLNKNIGLGHRRLSIIDTSNAGHQPYLSENKRFAMVFNGEIYNFKEFYTELEAKGIQIKTKSDTEILMHLFALFGTKMLNRLNGMFAIAIWDNEQKKLTLIRDRMGVKPLYYSFFKDSFFFASEQKALFSAGIPLKIADNGLEEYIFNRFVAGENTMYDNVFKLLPGHFMEVYENGKIETKKWWHLSTEIQNHETIKDPVGWFQETFDASIKLRMVSDVPVGVLLSGGLDSSSVLNSVSRQQFTDIETYNISFRQAQHNESHLAKHLAADYGFGFNSIELNNQNLFEKLIQATVNQDEPLMHLNEPHLLAISEMAKQKVKVLLSGEGADELMGGYVRYKALKNKSILKVLNGLSFMGNCIKNPRYQKLIRYASLQNDNDLIMFNGVNLYPKDIQSAFGISGNPENSYRKKILSEAASLYPKNLQRQALYFDQHTYLCSLLDRNDRCTMGASIECREPFLDQRLIVGIGTLDNKWLFSGKKGKFVLWKSMQDKLPSEILNFKKVGLSTPWGDYLTQNELLKNELNDFRKSEIFELPYLEAINPDELVNQFLKGNQLMVSYIMPLFMMHVWYKNYVQKSFLS